MREFGAVLPSHSYVVHDVFQLQAVSTSPIQLEMLLWGIVYHRYPLAPE